MSVAAAQTQVTEFEAEFPLLIDTADIYPVWKAIVQAAGVTGKQVHDARLVAVCHVHRITHLLTFNVGHFARLASVGPGVVVVDPATI
jgi:predicted nucleic acid-binding protein